MSAKRTQKSTNANSSSDSEDFDIFVKSDAEHRFVNFISAKSFHMERGFVFSLRDETLNIPDDFTRTITCLGWQRLAKHPSNYNFQWVKEFYANLTNPGQKKREVVVQGRGILYSEANINKHFNINMENDLYQATLASITDEELTTVMKNLTEEGTEWNYKNGVNEWTIRRMSLKPIMRVWYQFLKHTLHHTSHNETVTKARLEFLHCITAMQPINVGRIISQEIVNSSTKQEGVLFFTCLITALCNKNMVPEMSNDEVHMPSHGFDTKSIETLLKGNTGRKPRHQLPVEAPCHKVLTTDVGRLMYCFPEAGVYALPLFPREILGEAVDDDQPVREPTPAKAEPSTMPEKKKKKKKQRMPEDGQEEKNEEIMVSTATQKVSKNEEPEVNSLLKEGGDESERSEVEKNKGEEVVNDEVVGDEGHEDRPARKGHEDITIVKPSGEAKVVEKTQVSGEIAEGLTAPAANLATTEPDAAVGVDASLVAPPPKKKKVTKAKAAHKTKADKPSGANPEPSHSAEPVEEEISEVSKTVGTKRKKKEHGEPTRKSSRQRA
ncbi:hypothetical protein A2U01_0000632 [Trifolium medium]|uniref:Putative plant transposon protein domain-containing protein n=1 Tax=Trifolium medium TaxID=97028 RepID=A0A392LY31_9FABA|nr:hypothetical protein [Trifolium medium]